MKLYKYVSAERLDILRNEEICCTPPDRFKDPYELRANFAPSVSRSIVRKAATDLVKSEIPKGLSSRQKKLHFRQRRAKLIKGLDLDVLGTLQQTATAAIQRDKGILCFSSTLLENLMWYHYADGHRGFVIEFDSEDDHFKRLGNLIQVDYRSSPPIHRLHEPPTIDVFRVKPLYLKYEAEYRILRKLSDCERRPFRDGEDLYFCTLPRACVRAVHLGHRIAQKTRNELSDLLKGTKIAMNNVVPSSRNYTLEVRPFVTNSFSQ